MGYVAVRGGTEAINNASDFLAQRTWGGDTKEINLKQIRDQFHLAVDRIMSEGGLYAPDIAALCFKQSAGDTFEAAFMLRSYRCTQNRKGSAAPVSSKHIRPIRRISATFKDIPGGQILGPTPDYTLRLLDFELADMDSDAHRKTCASILDKLGDYGPLPEESASVIDLLRREGLIQQLGNETDVTDDITAVPIAYPASRSAKLQSLARSETGGALAIAYSSQRGYGMVHPAIAELRVGYLPVDIKDHAGNLMPAGEVLVTEAHVLSEQDFSTDDGRPTFALGYGLCFGHNELKAISMGTLDLSLQLGNHHEGQFSPAADEEFVLSHIDGVESMGFCNHFKMPHYVTFQSALDRIRNAGK